MRFVVLQHECPPESARETHWDFMLAQELVLRTWALAAMPDGAGSIDALALADHRLAYLDYEGPVSGNRGTVVRWDAGSYEWLADEPASVVVKLAGIRLRGVARLERTSASSQRWRFSFSSD